MAESEKKIPKHAGTCKRLLGLSFSACMSISNTLQKYEEDENLNTSEITIGVKMCISFLSTIYNPSIVDILVRDSGFQSWALVLHELLDELRLLCDHGNLYSYLDLQLKGPRLRRMLQRLSNKIVEHIHSATPHLDVLNVESLAINSTQGPLAFENHVFAKLRQNGGIFKIDHLIDDVEGRKWWLTNFKKKYAVEWEEIRRTLTSSNDPVITRLIDQAGRFELLRDVVAKNKRKAITALEFADFLYCYGPGLRVALIQMVASEESAPWFAGALTFDESRSVLAPRAAGTFLIRFSESTTCSWVASFINESSGLINHALIQATSREPNKGDPGADDSYFQCGSNKYRSFTELIEMHHSQLKYPAPKMKSLGPARCFRDFLTYEETQEMLEGKPEGTFLLRFSRNQEACLVVGYVTPDHRIKQSKIYCDPEKGFLLGNMYYRRISDLLRRNQDILKHPLAVEHDLFEFKSPSAEDEHDELLIYGMQKQAQQHQYTSITDTMIPSTSYSPLFENSVTYMPLGDAGSSPNFSAFETTYGHI